MNLKNIIAQLNFDIDVYMYYDGVIAKVMHAIITPLDDNEIPEGGKFTSPPVLVLFSLGIEQEAPDKLMRYYEDGYKNRMGIGDLVFSERADETNQRRPDNQSYSNDGDTST